MFCNFNMTNSQWKKSMEFGVVWNNCKSILSPATVFKRQQCIRSKTVGNKEKTLRKVTGGTQTARKPRFNLFLWNDNEKKVKFFSLKTQFYCIKAWLREVVLSPVLEISIVLRPGMYHLCSVSNLLSAYNFLLIEKA